MFEEVLSENAKKSLAILGKTGILKNAYLVKNKVATLKVHIIKSLSYFADADAEEMPRLFQPVPWKEIKKFLGREIRYWSRYFLLDSRK